MGWRHLMVVAGMALTAAPGAAKEATLADFAGSWRGTEVAVSGDPGGLTLEPADLDVEIESDGAGFRMRWTSLERRDGDTLARDTVDARFAPTDRPGVYAFTPGGSSLLSRLFADPATGNPLEGEVLLWARLAGTTLTVYGLAIDFHGGLELEQYAHTLNGDGLAVRYRHRRENDRVLTVEGRTVPAGG